AALEDLGPIREAVREVHRAEHMLYLGRGPDHPTALEGALKMKEVSYVHAEGYAAGEVKHGPIALVSWDTPVVAVMGHGTARARMIGNVREVKARDGLVLAVAAAGGHGGAKSARPRPRLPRPGPR